MRGRAKAMRFAREIRASHLQHRGCMTELKQLAQRRSDVEGLSQWAGHLAVIAASALAYERARAGALTWWIGAPAFVLLGFALVAMFAAMHETVHRTAFRSRVLNDAVAWIAGLLSFYPAEFYRYYHGWHHRFTQQPDKDPELEDGRPSGLGGYFWELSGIPWWLGKIKTFALLVLGRTEGFPYVLPGVRDRVVRAARWQVAVYAAALVSSLVPGGGLWFLRFWVAPVAVAQPLLRALLMAEHSLCSEDGDATTNTRTTYTNALVRFLMWNMPYHAEHHRHPALPFHTLAEAHEQIGPTLAHVARRGYLAFHVELVRAYARRGQVGSSE
jgi:fatty acid desaturase